MFSQIDYRLLISSGNFGVYSIEEETSPTPGFIGSWALVGTVSGAGGWSPPANILNPYPGFAGTCAYAVNGTLHICLAHNGWDAGFTTVDTGIVVAGSTLYSIFSDGSVLMITSGAGRSWIATDISPFFTDGVFSWTELSPGLLGLAPSPPTLTQADLDAANATAPPGLTFVFGTPTPLCLAGVNSRTSPPFAMQSEGGGMEFAHVNNNISARAGALCLTAAITGPLPPAIGQGGVLGRTGKPMRQEG